MVALAYEPKFLLGSIVGTPGALIALADNNQDPIPFLRRHLHGDWGDVCEDDKRANDQAVDSGGRLMSSYTLNDGRRIWIITEADRSVTTVLLPDEY